MHLMLYCHGNKTERKLLFDKLFTFRNFHCLSDFDKFIFLMSYNSGDPEILNLVLEFVNTSIQKRTEQLSKL